MRRYLQRRVGETFSSIIEIGWRDWLVTWSFLLLFWSVVQEGVMMEKLLFLYAFFIVIISSLCVILQAKIVWIKAQLIPRHASEMQSTWKPDTPRVKLAAPVQISNHFKILVCVSVSQVWASPCMSISHDSRHSFPEAVLGRYCRAEDLEPVFEMDG